MINKEIIEKKNTDIKIEGDRKIKLMEDIKNIKFDLALNTYQIQKKDLTIAKVECETKQVQLLKVKK